MPMRHTRTGAMLAAVAAILTIGPAAQAQQQRRFISEVRAGLMAHDVPIFSNREESGVDINGEILFTSPSLLRAIWAPRPHFGFSANTAGGMSQIYAGLSWEFTVWRRLFAGFSLGGAIHTGPLHDEQRAPGEKAFGSRGLF